MLDNYPPIQKLIESVAFHDTDRVYAELQRIAHLRIPLELIDVLVSQLTRHLATVSDPDMALNNLERFFSATRSPLSLASLFERDLSAIPILLKIFSTSQYLTDLIIRDPSSYDALRLAAGQPVSRQVLLDEIGSALEVVNVADTATAIASIRRFKHRETLRIAFGDIIGQQDLQTVTSQISYLADAICNAALDFAFRKLEARHGVPRSRSGEDSTVTVIAMGKLGGNELNYSSDIDLVFFYSGGGQTATASEGQRSIENRDFFDRLGREFVKLLAGNTPLGVAYRVDLRLRPGGDKSPLSCSFDNAISYYELRARTWERQALVKARVIAGDLNLGNRLLARLHDWAYARRLSINEINGIKALKRQIERRALIDGTDSRNVKTGRGGIRDIEFVIQFLQLLHGGELTSLRTGNTLEAIGKLYRAGCINSQEQRLLDRGYRWLRHLEHRLQIMFDLQTHSLPDTPDELYKVARRMDIGGSDRQETLRRFRRKLEQTEQHNRSILDHLLHDAFTEEATEDASQESDLILDGQMDEQTVEKILSSYGFENPLAAHRNLLMLATERNRFLTPRRCRHFLAAIARRLLAKIAETPQPDETLLNLTKVSDSLGGKAALWELFRVHPPSLELYVRLCASCDYLCRILVRNPGMIDELTDSLVLQDLPTLASLQSSLRELLAGAEDIDPIIHSFKDAQHLRVGVRDIIGIDEITTTHRALSDIAEVCLCEVVAIENIQLARRFGQPVTSDGVADHMIVLAMGKLGGREPNYHSDLDVVFLYASDGAWMTVGGPEITSHQDYYSRLAANVMKKFSAAGPHGKLYEIDCRLRPTGKSGSLAVSIKEFRRYFLEGSGQLWERLALCKARTLFRNLETSVEMRDLIRELIVSHPWQPEYADEIANMRLRMQEGASPRNIKRGHGGTVDIEFAVQMLQLKHAEKFPKVLLPNTVQSAAALHREGLLSSDNYEFFRKSYQMMRWVEARLRLMNTSARHDLPETGAGLAKLALLLGYPESQQLLNEIDYLRRENRRRFTQLVETHGNVDS